MAIQKHFFEIVNGDVITLTLNTETGHSVFTSARGNYELEKWFGNKFMDAVLGIVEHDTGHRPEIEFVMIRDHDDPPAPLDLT